MKITDQSFPHPVLGIQDDVSGIFKTQLTWTCDRVDYYLYPIFDLQNESIELLIKEKKVAYLVHIECANTFFRKSFKYFEQSPTIKINADELRDKVEISFFIVGLENISEYKNITAHQDYQGESFEIEKGDILAYGGETNFLAVKNYETLKAVSTIMVIKKDNNDKSLARVNYNSNKIELWLSKENFKIYNDYKNNEHFIAIFHTSLVLPLLLKALEYIKQDESDFCDYKWFLALKARLDDEDLSLDDDDKHFEIIQKLFGNPFDRFFKSINYLNEAMYNNE